MRPITSLRFVLVAMSLSLFAPAAMAKNIQTAVFAGGCFWCVEADMDKIDGVLSTSSGFTGGKVKNVTYKQVTKGGTGHYEAVRIKFDADIVSYGELVHKFFRSVDPLDAGGQFCDRGQSYATAIFAVTPQQAIDAEAAKRAASKALGKKVVTPIRMAGPFYLASDYHQDYYKQSKIVLTRFGPKSKAAAYKKYREACGRDKRVQQIWGKAKFPPSS